eukprot:sb/3472074/
MACERSRLEIPLTVRDRLAPRPLIFFPCLTKPCFTKNLNEQIVSSTKLENTAHCPIIISRVVTQQVPKQISEIPCLTKPCFTKNLNKQIVSSTKLENTAHCPIIISLSHCIERVVKLNNCHHGRSVRVMNNGGESPSHLSLILVSVWGPGPPGLEEVFINVLPLITRLCLLV